MKVELVLIWSCIFCNIVCAGEDEKYNTKVGTTVSKERYLQSVDQAKSASVDLNLSKETALKIAEIIFVATRGEKAWRERSWRVTDQGNAFQIEGARRPAYSGVHRIAIRKTDAQVLEFTLGK